MVLRGEAHVHDSVDKFMDVDGFLGVKWIATSKEQIKNGVEASENREWRTKRI